MLMVQINIKKSIEKKRLINNEPPYARILGIIVGITLSFFLVWVSLSAFISKAKLKLLIPALIEGFCVIAFSLLLYFLISNSLKSFRLIQLIGLNADYNRKWCTEILEKLESFKIHHNNQNYISAYGNSLDCTRELYIIFEKENIFINCTTITRTGILSFFHYWKDRKTERKFIALLNSSRANPV